MEGLMDRRGSEQVDSVTLETRRNGPSAPVRLKIPILCRDEPSANYMNIPLILSPLSPACFRLPPLPVRPRSASIIFQCSQTTILGQKLAAFPEARPGEIKAQKAPSPHRARTAAVSSNSAFSPVSSPSLSPVRRASTIASLTTRSRVPSSSQKVFGERPEGVRTMMLRRTRITSS